MAGTVRGSPERQLRRGQGAEATRSALREAKRTTGTAIVTRVSSKAGSRTIVTTYDKKGRAHQRVLRSGAERKFRDAAKDAGVKVEDS